MLDTPHINQDMRKAVSGAIAPASSRCHLGSFAKAARWRLLPLQSFPQLYNTAKYAKI